jgi:soluble lytic murein transglycosylase-like protein
MAVPFLACMIAVAQIGNLPPRVLPSIQAVEGGRPGLVHPNTDGSADLGLMQVNTLWVPVVARALGAPQNQVRAALTDDACFSIRVAGAILWEYRRARHGDLMLAIGDYHSHTPPLNQAYQQQVQARAAALFAGR